MKKLFKLYNQRFLFFSPPNGGETPGGSEEAPEGYKEAYEEAPGEYKEDPYANSADAQKKAERSIHIAEDEAERMYAALDASAAETNAVLDSDADSTETLKAERKPYSNEAFRETMSPEQKQQLQNLRNQAYASQSPADWNAYQDAVINMAYENGFTVPQRLPMPWQRYSNEAFFASLDVDQAFELKQMRDKAVAEKDEGQWNAYLNRVADIAKQNNFTTPPRAAVPWKSSEQPNA